MTEDEVRGLFTLAGLPIQNLWQLQNRYHGTNLRQSAEEVPPMPVYYEGQTLLDRHTLDFLNRALPAARDPWWLVKTPHGLIELGWRKRVINIDWSDTEFRGVITTHDVTKETHLVHAWGMERALEYLTELRRKLEGVK